MTRAITLLAVTATALLAGCTRVAEKPQAEPGIGSASYRTAEGTGLAHYDLAMGQIATGATLETHPAPAYPDAMLASCPPQVELPARVIVGTRGSVDEVRMSAPVTQQAFADAIRQAVQGWRYAPLTITRWAANADGTSHPVDTEVKPFSLDYVFTFCCEHGRTSVTTGPEQAAR
jgi:hypothetical protein